MMSTPIASGLPSAILLITLPCSARGYGHWSSSSAKVDSSIATITTDTVGVRFPRNSKSLSSDLYSSHSRPPNCTRTTTATPARMPARCLRPIPRIRDHETFIFDNVC